MSRRGPGDDEELEDPTAEARALLEGGESEAGNKRRRMSRSDEYQLPSERPDPTAFGALDTSTEDGVFGKDDLDIADEVAGEHPQDSLTRKVALRGRKWDDLNHQARFARISPPSVLKGTLGGQQVVFADDPLNPPPPGGQIKAQVALWGGEDAETLPVTIVLAPVDLRIPLNFIAGISNTDIPYGIVKFGTRGMLVTAEVDIGLGTQLTVGASYVSVEVALDLATPSFAPGVPVGSMKLAGMLSFYPIVRVIQNTRTKPVNFVAPGTQTIVVPPFAKNASFVGFNVGGATTLTLSFNNPGSGTQYQYDIPVPAFGTGMTTANGVLIPIPITGDIAHIVLSGPAGAAVGGRLIFGLTI